MIDPYAEESEAKRKNLHAKGNAIVALAHSGELFMQCVRVVMHQMDDADVDEATRRLARRVSKYCSLIQRKATEIAERDGL